MIIRLFRFLFIVMILLGLVLTAVCKKSEEGDSLDAATRLKIARTAGYTAATVADLAGKVFGNAIGIIGGGVDSRADGPVTDDFSYDPNTGWWSFSINLETGNISY
ncbi:MAG: hypothetical protein JSV88_23780 [Candidatus Aminicenantes bacterium]|nr:MAG: hypothetical protein JSV88_23780 [Candidatus Aminicenantes bacterium]